MVQVRLLLGTIWLLRAKCGQFLSVLITLGQVSITLRYIFDYSGFCLLVMVNLRYIIVTCNQGFGLSLL